MTTKWLTAPSLKSAVTIAVGLTLIGGVKEAKAASLTLYDASLQQVTPDKFKPQWLAFNNPPLLGGGTQSFKNSLKATNLNTSSRDSIQTGYSNYGYSLAPFPSLNLVNPQFPILNRKAGYTLSFNVEIQSESHTSNSRAGFSVIVVSSDTGKGIPSSIEIDFQDNRVFAQNDNPLFANPAAQQSAFDPVGVGFVNYDLVVSSSGYQLLANKTSILKGKLRDYTPFGGLFGIDPYETPNFIFLGDNTGSARANINLQRVVLTTNTILSSNRNAPSTAIPESSPLPGLLMLGIGMIGSGLCQRRSPKQPE